MLHDAFDAADKLEWEVDIFVQMRDHAVDAASFDQHLVLMLDQAKRVRRASTILIKALARERDNDATAEEAQANE